MRRTLIIAGLAVSALASAQYYGNTENAPVPGTGRVSTTSTTANVRVDQKLGEKIPLDLEFTDENGEKVQLKKYFTDKPVLLLPIFYECPGICTTELNNLVEVLGRFKREEDEPGKSFHVLIFSIEPKEGPEMAHSKKEAYLDLYNREGTEAGWSFLTGSQESITKLTDSVGFRYTYDDKGNIVHPASLVVLSREGAIAKYFLETEYQQYPLLDAIKMAAKNEVGERQQAGAFLACIKLNPMTSKTTVTVLNTLTVACLLTVVILGTSIFVMNRRYKVEMAEMEEEGTDNGPD